MDEKDKLIVKLYDAIDKLDTAYMDIGNNHDFSLGLTGEEYDEINDVMIEAEKYLFD